MGASSAPSASSRSAIRPACARSRPSRTPASYRDCTSTKVARACHHARRWARNRSRAAAARSAATSWRPAACAARAAANSSSARFAGSPACCSTPASASASASAARPAASNTLHRSKTRSGGCTPSAAYRSAASSRKPSAAGRSPACDGDVGPVVDRHRRLQLLPGLGVQALGDREVAVGAAGLAERGVRPGTGWCGRGPPTRGRRRGAARDRAIEVGERLVVPAEQRQQGRPAHQDPAAPITPVRAGHRLVERGQTGAVRPAIDRASTPRVACTSNARDSGRRTPARGAGRPQLGDAPRRRDRCRAGRLPAPGGRRRRRGRPDVRSSTRSACHQRVRRAATRPAAASRHRPASPQSGIARGS